MKSNLSGSKHITEAEGLAARGFRVCWYLFGETVVR